MAECKDCNKTFAEEHQQLIEDVCFLKEIAFADIFVKTSANDPQSSYLIDKITGVSGVIIYEDTDGVSGNVVKVTLDLPFLDDRYLADNILNFTLNGGLRNGLVCLKTLDSGIESLTYPNKSFPSTSWNLKIPKNFFPGQTTLAIDWTKNSSVSGIVLFNIEYASIASNETLSLAHMDTLTGIADNSILKMYNSEIELPNGIIEKEDQFLLKLTRLSQNLEDTLDTSVNIIGVSLKYSE